MSEMVRYGRGLATREERMAGREIDKVDARAKVSLARIERAADLQAAKVHGIAYIGKQALHAAAMVAETEHQLTQLTPHAASQLAAISDLTAMAIAETVGDSVRRVNG
jgi:hypothetical protein